MWEKFKWDIFVTSFIPLWLSIVVIDIRNVTLFIIDNWDGKGRFVDNLMCVLCGSITQLINIAITVILVLISTIGINAFLNKKLSKDEGHLPKGTIERATKANKLSFEFLLAYILPMVVSDFSNLQNLALFIIYFLVLAFLYIRNNNIYTNILLEFKGYHIYACNLTCKVIEDDHTYHDNIVISKMDLTQERSAVQTLPRKEPSHGNLKNQTLSCH